MRRRLIMTAAELDASRPIAKNQIGAWCMTCDGPSDYEGIVDQRKYEVDVRVRCHGQEEVGTFQFGTENWDAEDIKRAMQRRRWFDPHEGLGNIVNGGRIR